MEKHCWNCANHKKETNKFSDECEKCVTAVLENGEQTDPSHWREKPQTYADRIRAMSDEELADMIFKYGIDDKIAFCKELAKCQKLIELDRLNPWGKECKKCMLEWLKQPAEVDKQ